MLCKSIQQSDYHLHIKLSKEYVRVVVKSSMVKCGNGHVYAVLMLLLLGCFAIHAQCKCFNLFGFQQNLKSYFAYTDFTLSYTNPFLKKIILTNRPCHG